MTDNAAYFTSRDFQEFARKWDFCHITSSPQYPQSNGLAERALRSAKHLLEKCARDRRAVDGALLSLRQTVRMQTQRGYDRLAKVLATATQPNSYQVKAVDATTTTTPHT
ncbi:hypothetical protein D4764_09G0010160 [Takifugu flavidus]|uniref:Integrase catalytic domain-containing protein n=1 Tax=Takifugu flavidus TaxID=433684 RepID=A0A5C6MLC5_9TELE|nr:hypothetical protein D4764_09G0010160 [Takifugu flavidus]